MASESCNEHCDFRDKKVESIRDGCVEGSQGVCYKPCSMQDIENKPFENAKHTICNGFAENGHEPSDAVARNVQWSNMNLLVAQETNRADGTSILAIRKSRTDNVTVMEAPPPDASQTLEIRPQESCSYPQPGMIDLSSANAVFMQAKYSSTEPLYTNKRLPPFLQETLEQSLSRLTITIGNEKFLEEKSIVFIDYTSEEQLPDLTALITKDLSEPYSIYTYRYFLHNWPHLSFLAYCDKLCVGAVVCKLDQHRKDVWRGYIAMLAVHKDFRRFKIGTKLVQKAIRRMIEQGCDEIVLETEVTNKAALNLYENLGFVRDKRLLRYYLNGVDAWRLKLWLV